MTAVEIIKKLPKVDLHCHLDGSVRPQTLFEVAKKHKFKLPTDDPEKFKKYVQVSENCCSLTEFLEKFEFFYEFLKFPDVVERIAYELCEDLSKENVKYFEVRFVPYLQSKKNFSPEDVLKKALKGLIAGSKDFSIGFGIILCIYRSLSEEINWQTLKLAEKYFGKGVVGIDLAGDESKYPTENFAKFFKFAKSRKIPITCHAGEASGAESIKKTIEFGADRIGHAVHLLEDEALYKKVKDKKIPLEICLTSNIQTQVVKSYSVHPFKKFFEYGLKVTLNTDDRGVSGIDLTHEYLIAYKNYNLRISDLIRILMNGVDSLFLGEIEKENLRKKIKEEIEEILLGEKK
ncbi:MAG: adenosine deaminase [Endomicrobiia bacterium]